jgi:two-component system response regulator YesN
MWKRLAQSILARYIVSYIAVMGVLTAGVCLYVNGSIVSATRRSLVDANINRLGVLRVQHEERLAALLDVSIQISQSPDVSPFRFLDDPMSAFRLKQHLGAFTAAAGMCDQMYVIFDMDEYLYSVATSVSLPMLTELMMNLESTEPERLKGFIRNTGNEAELLPVQKARSILVNDADVVLMSAPLRLSGRAHIGNVMFVIKDASYQRLFADSVYERRNMYIAYKGEMLSAARRFDEVSDEAVLAAASAGEPVRTIVEGGVRYLLFAQDGDMLGMRYISLVPEEAVHMQTAQSLYAFAGFLALIFVPCVLLAVSFARRFERPIHEIRDTLSAERGGRGDHFDAIRSGIERLAEQNSQLHRRLYDSFSARSADFVKNFVTLSYGARAEAVEAALALGVDIGRASCYAVLLVSSAGLSLSRVAACVASAAKAPAGGAGAGGVLAGAGAGSVAKTPAIGAGDGSLAEVPASGLATGAALTNSCRTEGYGDVALLLMETVERGQYLLLAFADGLGALEEWAVAARAVLQEEDPDAVLATSSPRADFAEAGAAYLEASTAYDNRFVMATDQLLRFDDVSMAATGISEFAGSFVDGFRDALLAGDARAVHSRINELMQVLSERRLSLFAFRVIYNDIISTLLNRYFNGADENERLRTYDVFRLSRCRKASDLVDILRRICGEILAREAARPAASQETPEAAVVSRIGAHLREHFSDPSLSLGAVAESFGVSAARLSQVYREVTGMYPSDFLALLRMEKARELLLETGMSVRAVGEAVGYYDVTSFIRRFKRDMSMTPAQYRKAKSGAGAVVALEENEQSGTA